MAPEKFIDVMNSIPMDNLTKGESEFSMLVMVDMSSFFLLDILKTFQLTPYRKF